jgi:tRNA G46 methylase TrmB
MLDAKKMSEAIRMKRKKVKEDGVENMVNTSPLPQMNPQDIWNLEKKAQMEETIPGADEIGSGPGSATMEGPQKDDSQDVMNLKKQMARVEKILSKLSVG